MNIFYKIQVSVVIFFTFSSSLVAQSNNTSTPNIIVFMVDDMGWQDSSTPFWMEKTPNNNKYQTPNMSKLASEGTKFINAYATPVCTPSRVSMITGMNAAHHKVSNWTSPSPNTPTDAKDHQFAPPNWNFNGFSPIPNIPNTVHATSFVQLLKDAGYYTIHVGKAHWGSNGMPGSSPYNIGFMVNIAGNATGHPQSYLGKDNYGNLPFKAGLHAVPDLQQYYQSDTFLTEALTLEAIKAITTPINRKQPFYLNLSHYAVHVPFIADHRFYKKYLEQGLDSLEAAYATLIEGMDKSLGDIMHYIEEKGVADNTIIIFISDNGGLSIESSRSRPAHTQNFPLKAGKGSVYEGGIRVPMIIKWQNVVLPNSTTNQLSIIEDLFPTILEMAQIKNYTTIQSIDGKSLVPYLKNHKNVDVNKTLIWHYPHKWIPNDGPGINYFSAIRKGDWKLTRNIRNSKMELYHLKDDIGEQYNLIEKLPLKARELNTILDAKLKQWNALMPVLK